MELNLDNHFFKISISEAKLIQNELRGKVQLSGFEIRQSKNVLIGGADVSFFYPGDNTQEDKFAGVPVSRVSAFRSRKTLAIAGIVVIDAKTGEIQGQSVATLEINFPYIPGYLSFREGPVVIAALRELLLIPDVMIYDGCGIAHPRGLGLASHMGVVTGIPSIGCAKSLLCGEVSEPENLKGGRTEIILDGKVVGTCLRTKNNVKPVYVSPGHLLSIEDSAEIVLQLAIKYRLPEPTRLAHNLVTKERIAYQSKFLNIKKKLSTT